MLAADREPPVHSTARKWLVRVVVFALVLAGFGVLSVGGYVGWALSCRTPPKRDRYLVPEGYVGWIEVGYAIAGAAPLPIEDGFRLIRIDASSSSPSGSRLTGTGCLPFPPSTHRGGILAPARGRNAWDGRA